RTLMVLVRNHPTHSELWLALMQRSDPEARAFVAAARRHPEVMATVHLTEAARQFLITPVQAGVPL
ncbi:MAG: hypothetical protein KF861_20780, partial [Planctomycetaceae bacterium]|nr:hypothetical protein [Planctomycetaceae bacterium]